MPGYKHYSFDLWLTLIKSNPLFKKNRSRIFFEQYNRLGKSLEEIEAIFRQVDLMCNTINEATGKNIDADEMYLMVISMINGHDIALHEIDMNDLLWQMEALVFEFSPMLYSDDIAEVLAFLKENGSTLNILSNTGFINGSILRNILDRLSIGSYFNFQLYSDEVGLSKPNKEFFNLMLQNAHTLKPLQLQDIIHIGDNTKADITGAQNAGIHSLLVHSNNIPLNKLLNHAPQDILTA